jgi:hypothetical protein
MQSLTKIYKMLQDYEPMHSSFQIDNFIIGSQGNEWAQYNQCLREIKTRVEKIIQYEEEIELLILKEKKIICKIKKIFANKKIKKIYLNRKNRSLKNLQENIIHTNRELKKFVKIAVKLKKQIGDINNGRREQLEAEAWKAKAYQMAAIDIISAGIITKPTLEFIASFPQDEKAEIISAIKRKKIDVDKILIGQNESK